VVDDEDQKHACACIPIETPYLSALVSIDAGVYSLSMQIKCCKTKEEAAQVGGQTGRSVWQSWDRWLNLTFVAGFRCAWWLL
jgi:hypothetical protein